MLNLAEAQARLIALASPLPVEHAPLPEAINRFCAAPLRARRTQPSSDLSAMDGYAISSANMAGPWSVIGESAAGRRYPGTINPDQAVRIFTGAVLPEGADTVVIQEDVRRDGDQVGLLPSVAINARQHVRAMGTDFATGDVLIEPGEPMTPARIALAASGGYGAVPCRMRPSVEIIATGSELVPAGAPVGPDQIPESNALMLAAMLQDYRCTVSSPGVVPDDLETLKAVIGQSKADILVTAGGASVGDHDLVRPALEACGAELDFWKVAMRPGKPLMAGRQAGRVVLGLPGNPVSAFVTCVLFLRPLVAALSGANDPLPRRSAAILDGPLPPNGSRTDHLRGRRLGDRVEYLGRNDSAALLTLSHADALIVRPPNAPAAKTGDVVEIIAIA